MSLIECRIKKRRKAITMRLYPVSFLSAIILSGCDSQPESVDQQTTEKQTRATESDSPQQKAPNITVVYPNGGEEIERLKEFTIRWTSQDIGDRVRIKIHGGPDHSRGGWYSVVDDTENDGSYAFAIPQNWGRNKFKVRISAIGNSVSDQSDEHFVSGYALNLPSTLPENDTDATPAATPTTSKKKRDFQSPPQKLTISRIAAIDRIRELGGTYLSNGAILKGNDVSDSTMKYIGVLTELTHLALINTQVSDEGLKHLNGLTKLENLAFGGTHEITYAGIAHLKGLTNLKQLDLRGTTLTEEEELAIQAVMPNCQIIGNTVVDPFRRTR